MGPAAQRAPTILIVGGVAGGASSATRARRMSERARVVILERDAYVSFADCGLPCYLGGEISDRERLLIAQPSLFERRFCNEVRTRHEVVGIDRVARTIRVEDLETGRRYEERFDKLILAPGASPLVPAIPGVEAQGVDGLDPDQPTVVARRSGMRSYLGTRILAQHGLREVCNLSGAVAMRDFALNRRLPATLATATGLPAPDAIMID